MTHSVARLLALTETEDFSDKAALVLAECDDLPALIELAGRLRDAGHGDTVSYSRKVFIPLTRLCRDHCHYCTFAHLPRPGEEAFLAPEEVLSIARSGAAAGCHEALFTLGDKPELRYAAARQALDAKGYASTLAYLKAMAELVLQETGLLPHINAGVMDGIDLAQLREVSVSQGIMLETAAERLSRRGGPHFGSPDKDPSRRLACIDAAGRASVPFTSGLLIGIGETRAERIEALLALRTLHRHHGHLQEIIVQNFRAKPGTRMAGALEPSLDEHLWTIAVCRILFGSTMNIQAPPNLRRADLPAMIAAGINDWGGVSPVTPDHVNPEAPWPAVELLAEVTAAAGKHLVERLAIYPAFAGNPERWLHPPLRGSVLRRIDAQGFVRKDAWVAGTATSPPLSAGHRAAGAGQAALRAIIARAENGAQLDETDLVRMFRVQGADYDLVCDRADQLRQRVSGDTVGYVVTRNINYTNVCLYRCSFCAFSKGKLSENLRGRPYELQDAEIARRVSEAWSRGATEVCLQGGIHPSYTGATYLRICRIAKEAAPGIHVHAFSPLEVWHGATTLGLELNEFLRELKEAGLSSLPGTAAEILDDEVRAKICPDKVTTSQWLQVMEAAHGVGLTSTATIMFGHVDHHAHWARHLLQVRALQVRTSGFTEFVPLPFVPLETPVFLRAAARMGPTFSESILMHAVARLALHPLIPNIQTSWVKMGVAGASVALRAGANDLGGTLMDESITRAAGAIHGQEMSPERMQVAIKAVGRQPRQRTTSYGEAGAGRVLACQCAPPLVPRFDNPIGTASRR